ncbi:MULTISPECIES: hypothetical protein [Sorangium]|uniref:Uncharacterized protein n=1 Tax=Sorangium cellulosum TaxID=56 RepID=A0A4P2QFC1_SORCE|nr:MULTISPECIES: hypothetical protein [Sorangium]AUX28176.1 uncharacterized protein SOCE836_002440 [Sorangium cellulosum]WCQ87577.1 hypothetical protein NQZ70_00240 [Sorangium sp. Soce836]
MPLVESRLSPSVVRTLSLRRLTWERAAQKKLDILGRLRSRLAIDLSNYRETTIESSFGERIFAELFGYTTLFSSAGSNFEIYPKRYAGRDAQGRKHYDDFSIGVFDGDHSRVVVTVELKGPKTDLDKAQGKPGDKKYEGKSPAEQAIATAELFGECKWIVVSNFSEIRLYKSGDNDWSARAFLEHVRNRDDLAILLAHFDRRALIGVNSQKRRNGNGVEGELLMVIDKDHPAQPIALPIGGHRLLLRSGPSCADPKPLFQVESAIRDALKATQDELRRFLINDLGDSIDVGKIRLRAYDGWLSAEGESRTNDVAIKLAVSRYLEIIASFALPGREIRLKPSGVGIPAPETMHLAAAQLFFMLLQEVVPRAAGALNVGDQAAGLQIEGELLDAQGLGWNDIQLEGDQPTNHHGIPKSHGDAVRAGPFGLTGKHAIKDLAVKIMQELGVHFRSDAGGLLLDYNKIQSMFKKLQ